MTGCDCPHDRSLVWFGLGETLGKRILNIFGKLLEKKDFLESWSTSNQMLLLLAALLLSGASGAKIHKKYNTGFKRTTDGRVNVHIVPASHCDVGWLKTVDQVR